MTADGPFEVLDKASNKTVMFDPAGLERWGPYVQNYGGGEFGEIPTWQDYVHLYRHANGYWTQITHSFHCEVDVLVEVVALRVDDKTAVDLIVFNGDNPPDDLAQLADELVFCPGPPIDSSVQPCPVWDEDAQRTVLFDPSEFLRWGPYESQRHDDVHLGISYSSFLYRDADGVWTKVTHEVANGHGLGGHVARRISEHDAIEMIVSNGDEVPPDLAHIAKLSGTLDDKPYWNSETGKLTFRGATVETIKNLGPAKNVTCVLDEGWAQVISDPLSSGKDQTKQDGVEAEDDYLDLAIAGLRITRGELSAEFTGATIGLIIQLRLAGPVGLKYKDLMDALNIERDALDKRKRASRAPLLEIGLKIESCGGIWTLVELPSKKSDQ